MVDGKISALGTPDELKQRFHQRDMDHVFTYMARQATRSSD
jgi:ABC-2 type transport system ATP-binding protein